MESKGPFDAKGIFGRISKNKFTAVLVIVGFIGIALIFLSDFFHTSSTASQQNVSSSDSMSSYECKIQSRLEDIISRINGVGKVKVMVTVESGVENVYEKDNKITNDKTQNGGDQSGQTQQNSTSESSHVILSNQNGGQDALLTKQVKPDILGVVIVCDGGSNPDVQENVLDAVSTALGISSDKISISKMQQNSR